MYMQTYFHVLGHAKFREIANLQSYMCLIVNRYGDKMQTHVKIIGTKLRKIIVQLKQI